MEKRVFSKTWIALSFLTIAIALLMACAANATRSSFARAAQGTPNPVLTSAAPLKANDSAPSASPCVNALSQGAVCTAANQRALEIMNSSKLEAITVVQDVQTGAVVAYAASQPSKLDVTTIVLPLSISKVFMSASWWDNNQPNSDFDSTKGSAESQNPAYRNRVSVHEMLVGGSDSAGRQMSLALRKAVGTKKVLEDFERYGLGRRTDLRQDDKFWAELAPVWKPRLVPAPAYVSLSNETKDAEWAETMSLGETNMGVTALHVSRFLQAVGNGGVMLMPVAREGQSASSGTRPAVPLRRPNNSIRIMRESTAHRLQSAMRDTVQRGTAKSIAQVLKDTGWQIGGKTGTGPGPMPPGPQSDGWFAGLIFDPHGKARFTVATYVRHGGFGGGNAARISAELARFMVGENAAVIH
jgi:cell division protein FtsI/penicillin-binding protein 2